MSFTEKIDVLDLLIQTLKDHEEKLDQIAERLENATKPRSQVDDHDQMRRFYENL